MCRREEAFVARIWANQSSKIYMFVTKVCNWTARKELSIGDNIRSLFYELQAIATVHHLLHVQWS